MNCRQAERRLLRSFDGRITAEERSELEAHLRHCSRCARLEVDYQRLLSWIKLDQTAEPLPYFWERLDKKIAALGRPEPEVIWQPILVRAVTIALIGLIVLTGLLIFWPPGKSVNFSQTEALIFQEAPFPEVQQILNEPQPEQRNLRLMFSSLEATSRRYLP
ncbi:MAG: zf-HC2 domain-containing protein [Candidatus Aminicenantes bacterium]|nr:zf-HC2 domain-containing protein [Candidatus Aminicenantes bacterium]